MKNKYLAWTLPILMMGNSCLASFDVQVRDLDGTIIKITIKGTDTIEEVKGKIQRRWRYRIKDQRLVFAGKKLENTKTVKDHSGIKNGSMFYLVPEIDAKPDPKLPFDIEVKYGGETIKMTIKGEDTIKEVKEKIKNKSGYRPEDQKLSLGSKDMENSKQVTDYNAEFKKDVTITLTPKPGAKPGYTLNQKIAFALLGIAVIAGLLFGYFFFAKEEVDEANKDAEEHKRRSKSNTNKANKEAEGNERTIKPKAVRA